MRTQYLYRRPGSRNWWLRLKSDDPAFRVNRSTGTADYNEAYLQSLPVIQAHQQRLAEKPRMVTTAEWKPDYRQGVHTVEGVQVLATERDLYSLDGKRIGSNGGFARSLVMPGKWTPTKHMQAHLADADETIRRAEGLPAAVSQSRTVAVKTEDDKIFESYKSHGGENGTGVKAKNVKECETMWHLYKTLCVDANGENHSARQATLRQCASNRKHLKGTGNASMTSPRPQDDLARGRREPWHQGGQDCACGEPVRRHQPERKGRQDTQADFR